MSDETRSSPFGADLTARALTLPPPIDALFEPGLRASIWPATLLKRPAFTRQIAARKGLLDSLDAIQSALPSPDTTLLRALDLGVVTRAQVSRFLALMTDLLNTHSDCHRCVLYFPFELLPPSEDRGDVAVAFRSAFMTAWRGLLSMHDVRANFVDGDVIEVDLRDGDPPRVVKAAHLTPHLVNAGLLTVGDLLRELDEVSDPLLAQSFADGLPMLDHLGLLSEADRAAVFRSAHPVLGGALRLAADHGLVPAAFAPLCPEDLAVQLEQRLTELDRARDARGVTPRRAAWLREIAVEEAVEDLSGQVARAILGGAPVSDALLAADGLTCAALVEALRKAILSDSDVASARRRYEASREALEERWCSADDVLREALKRFLRHLHSVGLVSGAELQKFGVTLPSLAGPVRDNMAQMAAEFGDMEALVARMALDPLLSATVYPTLIVFGSRLKGYGHGRSDLDLAVFIKPETPIGQQAAIRARLGEVLVHRFIQSPVFEFWLEEGADGSLSIKAQGEGFDPIHGEDTWVHVVLGGAWVGEAEVMQALQSGLLPGFVEVSGRRKHGVDLRALYLEELERDTLQYRLMHRGYARLKAPVGGLEGGASGGLDGASAFWDSGYRQAALRIYLSRVFLPCVTAVK